MYTMDQFETRRKDLLVHKGRLTIFQTVEIIVVFSKSTHHTKKKLSSLIALFLFQTFNSLKDSLEIQY